MLELREASRSVIVRSEHGDIEAAAAVNCAGLQADQLAGCGRTSGAHGLRIVPFRGEYRRLRDERAHLVRTMIYPVPDPRVPFLALRK